MEKIIEARSHESSNKEYSNTKAPFVDKLEKSSREARQLLDLEISDARSLKNRLRAGNIREIVSLYQDFQKEGHLDRLPIVVKDCLLTHYRTDKFLKIIGDIVKNSELIQIPDHM